MGTTSSSSASQPHTARDRNANTAASHRVKPNGIRNPVVKRELPTGGNASTVEVRSTSRSSTSVKKKISASPPDAVINEMQRTTSLVHTASGMGDGGALHVHVGNNDPSVAVPVVAAMEDAVLKSDTQKQFHPPSTVPYREEQTSGTSKEFHGVEIEDRNDHYSGINAERHVFDCSSRTMANMPPLSFSTKVSPADVNPQCRLKVEEGPLCMDYHPGFNILLIGSAKEINFIKVNPTAAHGVEFVTDSAGVDEDRLEREPSVLLKSNTSSPVRPIATGSPSTVKSSPPVGIGKKKNIATEGISSSCHTPRPTSAKPLVLLEKYKGPQKVEDIMWHPNQKEATFAFVEASKITILMDVLQFRQNTKNINVSASSKAPISSSSASTQTPARTSAVETTTSGISFQRVQPLARNRKKLATEQTVSGRVDPPGRYMPPHNNVQVNLFSESLLRQVEPFPKELLELTIPTTYAKTSRVAWDPHHPYTLAVTSVATYFELWEIPIMNVSTEEALREYRRRGDKHITEEKKNVTETQRWMKVGKPRLLLRPPATSSRRAAPQDVCFSPFNPAWIVVVSEDSGHTSDVRIFDRHSIDHPSTVFVLPITGLGLSASFHPLYRDILAVSYRKGRTKPSSTVEFWEIIVDQSSTTAGGSTSNAARDCADPAEGRDVSSSSSSLSSSLVKEKSISPPSPSQTTVVKRHQVIEDGTDPNWSVSTACPRGERKGVSSSRGTTGGQDHLPRISSADVRSHGDGAQEVSQEKIVEVRRDVLPSISSYVCFARFRWRPPSYSANSRSVELERTRHHLNVRVTSVTESSPLPLSNPYTSRFDPTLNREENNKGSSLHSLSSVKRERTHDRSKDLNIDENLVRNGMLSLSEAYLSQMWFATSFTDTDSTVCIWDAAYRYSPIIQYNFIPPDNPLPPALGGVVATHLPTGSSLSTGDTPLVMGSTLGLPVNSGSVGSATVASRNKKKEIDAVPADVVWTDSLGLVAVFRSGEVVFASLISDESFHEEKGEEKHPFCNASSKGSESGAWRNKQHHSRNSSPLPYVAAAPMPPHTISFSPLAHFPTATIQANPYGGFVLQQDHGGIGQCLSHGDPLPSSLTSPSAPLFVQLKDYYSRVLRHDIGAWILEHLPSWPLLLCGQEGPSPLSIQPSQSGESFDEEQRHSWSPFTEVIRNGIHNNNNNNSGTIITVRSPVRGDNSEVQDERKGDYPSSMLLASSSVPAYPRKTLIGRHPTFSCPENEEKPNRTSFPAGNTTAGTEESTSPFPHPFPEEQLDYSPASVSGCRHIQRKPQRYYFGSFFRELQAKELEFTAGSHGYQQSERHVSRPPLFGNPSPQTMLLTQLGVAHPRIQFCNSIYAPTPLISDVNEGSGSYRIYPPSLSTLSRSCWGGSYKEHPQERDKFLAFAMQWDMGYDAALQLQQLNAHLKKWHQSSRERREGNTEGSGGGLPGGINDEGSPPLDVVTPGTEIRPQRAGKTSTPGNAEGTAAVHPSHHHGMSLKLLSSISEGSLLKSSVQEEQRRRYPLMKEESEHSSLSHFQGENEPSQSIGPQHTLSSVRNDEEGLEEADEELLQLEDLLELVGNAIDIYFADRMQHNADICEQQAVNDNTRFAAALTHSCASFLPVRSSTVNHAMLDNQNDSVRGSTAAETAARNAMMATLSEEDIVLLQENHRREQQQDGRSHWWAAAAHAWRSNLPSLILTFTVSQLEQASLLGDCQFCITLYQLYGLWWKLRRAVTEAATRGWAQSTISQRSSERRKRNADVDIFHFDGSSSCPLLPTPIDPEAAKHMEVGGGSETRRQVQTMPLHSYLGPNTSSVSALPTVGRTVQWPECSPEAWRQRGLQWLDEYVAQLHTADLFVPINELYLITQEIFGVDNPILYSSHLAYEKQLTYVFCEECKEREVQSRASPHHSNTTPSVSSSSKQNKGKIEAPPLIVNTKAIRQHREHSGADSGVDPIVNLEATIAMVVSEGRPSNRNGGINKKKGVRGSSFMGPSVLSSVMTSCHHCHKRSLCLQQAKEERRLLKKGGERVFNSRNGERSGGDTQWQKRTGKMDDSLPENSTQKTQQMKVHRTKCHTRRKASYSLTSASSFSSHPSSICSSEDENNSTSTSPTYSSSYTYTTTLSSESSSSRSDDETDGSSMFSSSSSSSSSLLMHPEHSLRGTTHYKDGNHLRRARNHRMAFGSIFHFWVSPRLPAVLTPSAFTDALITQLSLNPEWERKWRPHRLGKRISSASSRPIKTRPNIRLLHAERMKQKGNTTDTSIHSLTEVHPHRISLENHHRPLLNAVCLSCFNFNGMTCVICDALVEGIFVRFPRCAHGGHSEHVQEWIQRSDACPSCGAAIHASATAKAAEEEVFRLLYD